MLSYMDEFYVLSQVIFPRAWSMLVILITFLIIFIEYFCVCYVGGWVGLGGAGDFAT